MIRRSAHVGVRIPQVAGLAKRGAALRCVCTKAKNEGAEGEHIAARVVGTTRPGRMVEA